ncbi:uncharacterized protein BO95DRAFT_476086 [Aspergillus brunneoviolaceus CBS 621.78]|uniref:Uncharacterized protein n=1 Tax=Aspergillus brunneoviolaceus CBS 621.78 TaxID=1450534 RepID=A0ACD1FYW5_9EURO|nr:hypothetical protein BO95DRAFT_476086 [Aspergillus brunneoviolaceus CBS 621.78]RAH42164.1 hypothetical protein BO95DRAFT_476086 [Aspergillus brunneoviolaceus CBS 621.78]
MDSNSSNSRVSVACETCRRRKRKCDGLRPACSLCITKRAVCQYNTEKRNRRRVDADYVRGLEDQIAMLKEELHRPQPVNAVTLTENVRLGRKEACANSHNNTADPATVASAIPDNMSTAIEDVSALIWRMSIESNGEEAFIGPSGNFCFPVSHWEDLSTGGQKHMPSTTIPSPSSWEQSSGSSRTDIRSTTSYLLALFTQCVNPIHQFVDTETLNKLHGDHLNADLTLIKTAALAAGALYSDDAKSRTVGEEAAAVVDAMVMQHCRESPSVHTVQALSIMCWRELGLEEHNMAWMYNSMCASMALHLGLPVSMAQETKLSDAESSRSSRSVESALVISIHGSVYRIATSLLGRNCMLPWRRIKTQFFISTVGPVPSLDELAFDHQCRLWFIHDQHMDRIYSFEFTSLSSAQKSHILLNARDQLYAFRRQVDPQIQLGRTRAIVPSIIYLHISYHMSHILIHRPYLKQATQRSSMYQLCVRAMSTAAASIVRLLREYRKVAPVDHMPPFVVHSVLTAAVTHLCNATSTYQALRSASTAQFRVCFHVLWVMQQRWVKARRAICLLRQLARRWQVMGALPLQHGFSAVSNPREEAPEEEQLESECSKLGVPSALSLLKRVGHWGGFIRTRRSSSSGLTVRQKLGGVKRRKTNSASIIPQ